MITREFKGLQLSGLGFGMMRLPVLDGDDARIDRAKAFQLVDAALAEGINYYDTAWGYHGGMSEIALGEALRRHPRHNWYIATKFPGYDVANMPRVREIFERQLEKTGMEYFDFYLLHNVNESNIDAYMDPRYAVLETLLEEKRRGRIRHLGFSCHAEPETLERFLDAWGPYMEFCQLQLNYLDWEFQRGREKVALLNARGIPIWVMEPLRGGKLAKLDADSAEILKALRPDEGIPAWAFRFLQSIPGVTMILSGMSNMEQLRENIDTFGSEEPLTEKECAALDEIAARLRARVSVPCTACRYCVSKCPRGLDIPRFIALYNEHLVTTEDGGWDFIAPMALQAVARERRPAACLHCRSCERVCPQGIHISDLMSDFVVKIG